MKKRIALFLCLFCSLALPVSLYAEEEQEDTLFVVKKNGTIDIYPASTVQSKDVVGNMLRVTLCSGKVRRYAINELESYDHQVDIARPTLTSFKFNNKFNHQLFDDVECAISDDRSITGRIAAIGHWLTPSFKRSDNRACVYLDEKDSLVSKHSRVKFGAEHTVTVAYPGIQMLKSVMVSPGTDGESTIKKEEIALTEDMLSTNAPSNYPEREGLAMLIDDDPSTFFHSTWGSGQYEKLPEDEFPYIEITLPDAVYHLVYETTSRTDTGARSPEILSLMASNNGTDWVEVHRFMEANGFSSAQGATNTSSVIDMEMGYCRFRLYLLKSNYKNYFCLSELKLYSVSIVEGEGMPATYEDQMVPFGTEYKLNLDWVKATAVPRVDINIEDGRVPSSKNYYLDAEITIDGAGFYPSMETTPVQIKGRGNSSWSSNSNSKNPYRLKFEEKQKPFGLKNGKSWVLLSNRKTNSMMTNAIGMYAAGLIGADGANHIVPIELYLNGNYWGSYNFTEKVGLANNSIDLDDESKACLIELDTYDDEPIYKSTPYNIPVKVKKPDFDEDETELTSYQDIMSRFNAFTALVRDGADISQEVDVESMARFMVIDELILNYELMHPKSTYLYHENVFADTCKWKWGPVWDLDWCFGFENGGGYYMSGMSDSYWIRQTNMEAYNFIRKMRTCGEPFDRAMYKYWSRFMRLYLEELIDYCDDYYAFAKPSLENNVNSFHGDSRDRSNYAASTENAKKWLRSRAKAAYAQLTPYPDISEEEILGIPEAEDDPDSDTPIYTDGVSMPLQPTHFTVYDMRGVMLKSGATYDNWRNGLAPGIYIVNGKKVLVR